MSYTPVSYTYGFSSGYWSGIWGDLLKSYNGQQISYDDVGNPVEIGNYELTWTQGRRLSAFEEDGGLSVQYTYNTGGIRTSKTVGGVEHRYTLNGTQVLSEEWDVVGYLCKRVHEEFGGASLSNISFNRYDCCTETERNEYKQRLIGYRYRHMMKIEFGSDNDRLGRILYALARCELNPEFNKSCFVKDQESAKDELLGNAVADAKEKANVLARAADLQLKEIQTVDYSWGEISIFVKIMS